MRAPSAAINFDHFHTIIALHATGLQLCLTTCLLYILLAEHTTVYYAIDEASNGAPRIREKYFLRNEKSNFIYLHMYLYDEPKFALQAKPNSTVQK